MTQLLVNRIAIDEPSAPPRRVRTGVTGGCGPAGFRSARGRAGDCARGVQAGVLGEPRHRPFRPDVFWPDPSWCRRRGARAQSCTMPQLHVSAPTVCAPTWRLTDRGVAVLLVAGLMIMVAALTVVGLTAITVTGEGYRATVSSSLPR